MRCSNHNMLWTTKHICGSNIIEYLRIWAVDHMLFIFLVLIVLYFIYLLIHRTRTHAPKESEAVGYLRQIALHMSDVKDRM